jgi:type IV fimbrial biogenesis protein FimT
VVIAMRPRRHAGREAGFNIIELMVVVFIVGVLAAIAAPNMGKMVRTQRIKTGAFDVYASLTLARNEAVKRNSTVTLTPVSSDWAKGWTIKDANNNVLKEQGELTSVTVVGPASVAYASNGRLPTGNAVAQFDLSTANVNANSLRCVKVDTSGRPTSKECSCASTC